MSSPDDPFAPPPRDREAGRRPARGTETSGAGTGPSAGPDEPAPWGVPTGPPQAGPGAPEPPAGGREARSLGTAALVTGLLALVLGVTVVGGVLLGTLSITLGVRAQHRARAAGTRSGTATAGIVLGAFGMAVAGATYLWIRGPLEEYQGCRKESVSIAQDQACEREFRRSVEGR